MINLNTPLPVFIAPVITSLGLASVVLYIIVNSNIKNSLTNLGVIMFSFTGGMILTLIMEGIYTLTSN